MTGEFTHFCTRYYKLCQRFYKRNDRLKELLDNAPQYTGQTSLAEIDAIIEHCRKVQEAEAKADEVLNELAKTRRCILEFMKHFQIPPWKSLYGAIPGELEYEVWITENDVVCITKTRDLEPEPENPNVILIKLSGWEEEED
jgi:hypothetical protein